MTPRALLSAIVSLGLLSTLGVACGGGEEDTGSPGGGAAGSGGSGGGDILRLEGDDQEVGKGPPLLGTDCDPLGGRCGMPFPSNVYRVDDPDKKNPSGKRVQFGKYTLPHYQGKKSFFMDPSLWYDSDGFSPGQAPFTWLEGATAAGLATPDTIPSTLSPDSPSILLDADTGELVPHWIDIDMSTKEEDERAVLVRPAVRLKDNTRYIVALRNVKDQGGAAIPASKAFTALRDGGSYNHPSIELRRELYKDIFAKLEAAGVKKDGLQIAWDYTTATRENNTRWLVHMRDEALAKYTSFQYKIEKVEEDPNKWTAKRVHVKFTVPRYLTTEERYDAGKGGPVSRLVFGPDGNPQQNGEFDWDLVVHIPKSTATGEKHGLLQNGHGLLGSRFEGQNGYLAEMANDYKWIAFSVNLFGFAEDDVGIVMDGLGGKPENLRGFIDRQVQGQLMQLLAMRFMINTFSKDPILQVNGASVVDTDLRAYRGDSQGGIMGTAYMGMTTDVTRGLVGEPGMSYNLLLNRSKDYAGYGLVLNGSYPNGFDQQVLLGLIQMFWDRSEPTGYAPYITENMLPGTPQHQILIHDALGDHQVTTYGAHIIARAVKAKALTPAVRPIWGLEEAASVKDGSAIVEYDFQLPKEPLTNTPPAWDPDPHDMVRQLLPSYKQSDHFFRTGEIVPMCDGTCSCFDATPEQNCLRFECEALDALCELCPSDVKKDCKAALSQAKSSAGDDAAKGALCRDARLKYVPLGCTYPTK